MKVARCLSCVLLMAVLAVGVWAEDSTAVLGKALDSGLEDLDSFDEGVFRTGSAAPAANVPAPPPQGSEDAEDAEDAEAHESASVYSFNAMQAATDVAGAGLISEKAAETHRMAQKFLQDTSATADEMFGEINREQQILMAKRVLVARQRESIKESERSLKRLKALIMDNKGTLAKNEDALRGASDDLLKLVSEYQTKLRDNLPRKVPKQKGRSLHARKQKGRSLMPKKTAKKGKGKGKGKGKAKAAAKGKGKAKGTKPAVATKAAAAAAATAKKMKFAEELDADEENDAEEDTDEDAEEAIDEEDAEDGEETDAESDDEEEAESEEETDAEAEEDSDSESEESEDSESESLMEMESAAHMDSDNIDIDLGIGREPALDAADADLEDVHSMGNLLPGLSAPPKLYLPDEEDM